MSGRHPASFLGMTLVSICIISMVKKLSRYLKCSSIWFKGHKIEGLSFIQECMPHFLRDSFITISGIPICVAMNVK